MQAFGFPGQQQPQANAQQMMMNPMMQMMMMQAMANPMMMANFGKMMQPQPQQQV